MIRTYKGVPLLGVTANSGTGKTTLLTKIIPILKASGIKIGCIKHTHHRLDLDTPGKDSYRLSEAGVDQMFDVLPRWCWYVAPHTARPSTPRSALCAFACRCKNY